MNDGYSSPAGSQDELPRPQLQQPLAPKEKHSRAVTSLSILFLLMLLAAGVVTYLWFNNKQEIDRKQADLSISQDLVNQLRTQLSKARSQATVATNSSSGLPDFGAFDREYQKIVQASVPTDRTATKKEIESALKSYYKLTDLPAGWDLVTVYQVVKPQTPPSGELMALVYWPASGTKPAGFVSMIKPVGGTWKYNQML